MPGKNRKGRNGRGSTERRMGTGTVQGPQPQWWYRGVEPHIGTTGPTKPRLSDPSYKCICRGKLTLVVALVLELCMPETQL